MVSPLTLSNPFLLSVQSIALAISALLCGGCQTGHVGANCEAVIQYTALSGGRGEAYQLVQSHTSSGVEDPAVEARDTSVSGPESCIN